VTVQSTHYVCKEPFDPVADDAVGSGLSDKFLNASQGQLIWWRFKRHRVAYIALFVLALSYFSIVVTEFLAPYNLHTRHSNYLYMPPQQVHFFHDGHFLGPFTYGVETRRNDETLELEYVEKTDRIYPVRFFCSGDPYKFWGLFEGDFHLVCPGEGGTLFLLGTDRLGRDMASRLLYGGRISLTVGLIGVGLSFFLGLLLGGLAGYFGGWIDNIIQRVIEILQSLPHLPLWMALSAALPVYWSPILVYFGLTIILAVLSWTGLARAVRSKLLALREEDFCVAAQLMGARPSRIISYHLLPNFMSHLIASVTLAIPSMILAETALSFLGLGLKAPITSWGVLLAEAQNIEAVALYPWVMLPMLPVVITVLAFNFLGDGLRDAIDPHS
jgi:peptide/nickel transport system permease protein